MSGSSNVAGNTELFTPTGGPGTLQAPGTLQPPAGTLHPPAGTLQAPPGTLQPPIPPQNLQQCAADAGLTASALDSYASVIDPSTPIESMISSSFNQQELNVISQLMGNIVDNEALMFPQPQTGGYDVLGAPPPPPYSAIAPLSSCSSGVPLMVCPSNGQAAFTTAGVMSCPSASPATGGVTGPSTNGSICPSSGGNLGSTVSGTMCPSTTGPMAMTTTGSLQYLSNSSSLSCTGVMGSSYSTAVPNSLNSATFPVANTFPSSVTNNMVCSSGDHVGNFNSINAVNSAGIGNNVTNVSSVPYSMPPSSSARMDSPTVVQNSGLLTPVTASTPEKKASNEPPLSTTINFNNTVMNSNVSQSTIPAHSVASFQTMNHQIISSTKSSEVPAISQDVSSFPRSQSVVSSNPRQFSVLSANQSANFTSNLCMNGRINSPVQSASPSNNDTDNSSDVPISQSASYGAQPPVYSQKSTVPSNQVSGNSFIRLNLGTGKLGEAMLSPAGDYSLPSPGFSPSVSSSSTDYVVGEGAENGGAVKVAEQISSGVAFGRQSSSIPSAVFVTSASAIPAGGVTVPAVVGPHITCRATEDSTPTAVASPTPDGGTESNAGSFSQLPSPSMPPTPSDDDMTSVVEFPSPTASDPSMTDLDPSSDIPRTPDLPHQERLYPSDCRILPSSFSLIDAKAPAPRFH